MSALDPRAAARELRALSKALWVRPRVGAPKGTDWLRDNWGPEVAARDRDLIETCALYFGADGAPAFPLEPVYVAPDVCSVIYQLNDSAPLEDALDPKHLVTPAAFVYFDHGCADPQRCDHVRALMWVPTWSGVVARGAGTPDGVHVARIVMSYPSEDDPARRVFHGIGGWEHYEFGAPLTSTGDDTLALLFVATTRFMSHRIVARTRMATGASAHRSCDPNPPLSPSVHVITLRRRVATPPADAPRQRGVREIRWNYRWGVIGHWRRMHVGSGRARVETRIVVGHPKGPVGLPIKNAERIWKVIR